MARKKEKKKREKFTAVIIIIAVLVVIISWLFKQKEEKESLKRKHNKMMGLINKKESLSEKLEEVTKAINKNVITAFICVFLIVNIFLYYKSNYDFNIIILYNTLFFLHSYLLSHYKESKT